MDSAYMDRFGGVARLLGVQALGRLFQSHVAVVGIGGVGSWVVEALARSGVGNLTLIDLDDVCITNTNRQLPALETTLGRPKVDVLADRVRQINPACGVHALGEFFTAQSAERLMATHFDCVVDAIDHLANKCLLIDSARRRGYPVVTIGGAGGKRDAGRIERGDLGDAFSDELLRQVRKRLRRDHGFAPGEAKGNAKFGIRCVWSAEQRVYPRGDGTCGLEPRRGESLRMDCADGFGAGVWVTGSFGFAAAQEAIEQVLTGGPRGQH
ncbi:MAG: tRNA threonylcarbamoyladenosine dehydratase [Opitutaceae bacterium]|nr:tRNA threonylcarbamoyladenosine dehydratase [Opitutaceae bacterium]